MEVAVEALEILTLAFGTIMTGVLAYYAWFRPKTVRHWLEVYARIYHGWMPMTEWAVKTPLTFHLLRITDTVFFGLSLVVWTRELFFSY